MVSSIQVYRRGYGEQEGREGFARLNAPGPRFKSR